MSRRNEIRLSKAKQEKELHERIAKLLKTEEGERKVWFFYKSDAVQLSTGKKNSLRSILAQHYMRDTARVADIYYAKSVPDHSWAEKSDIRQAAFEGMLEALDRYDPSRHDNFMRYANSKHHSRIRGAILDELRRMMGFPRLISKLRKAITPMMQCLEHKINRAPNKEEFIQEYGEGYRLIIEDSLLFSGVYNQSQEETDSHGEQYQDFFSCIQDLSESSNSKWSLEDRINFEEKILSVIPDKRERFAVYAYHWWNWNYRRIGKSKSMNCSPSTAQTLRFSGEAKIRINFTRQDLLKMLNKQ